MKHSIKISVMALVAMFAVSTTADAQFGALKKLTGKKSKTVGVLPSKKPVEVKGEIKPYDENAELGKDMVRTIFMQNGQKMMVDQPVAKQYYNSYSSDFTKMIIEDINKEYVQTWLNCTWKDAAFMERAKEDFISKHKTYTLRKLLMYAGTAEKWKVSHLGTDATGWQYNRDQWGNITYRYFKVYIVIELDNGQNIMVPFEVCENNAGGANYDEDTLSWNFSGWDNNRGNFFPRALSGWEVKTDCYTSTLTGK